MSVLLISYDLHTPGQDYEMLHRRIKLLGAWWHHLESTWLVDCSLTPSQAFDRLRPAFDDSSSMLIVDISGAQNAGWLNQRAWDWINQHV